MYLITFIYLAIFQDSLSVLKFNNISVMEIPDSINIVIDTNIIAVSKQGFNDAFIPLDSAYFYTKINDKIVGIKEGSTEENINDIYLYFTDYPKNRFILNKLRSTNDFHDFMFYYAGIERAEFKEYFKAEYNFRKAYELGIRTPLLRSELFRIQTLLKKTFKYDEKVSSITVNNITWVLKEKHVEEKPTVYYTITVLYQIGGFLFCILFSLFLKKKKRQKKNIAKFDDILKNKPKTEKKIPLKKEIKKVEISEKKKQLLDVTKHLEKNRKNVPKFDSVDEKMYTTPDQFETEQLNQNLGEVELALNLQSIKRRHTKVSSKYEEISELKMQHLTTEEIAKQLNITVTEVELFNSFKDQN